MNKTTQTKQFFLKFQETMHGHRVSGKKFTREFLSQFSSDPKYIEHVLFFDKAFPGYDVFPKEIIAADNKIFMQVEFRGKHTGQVGNIPPTHKDVAIPFAVIYTIENDKIVDFSAIASELEFFEQLGLTKEQLEVPIAV